MILNAHSASILCLIKPRYNSKHLHQISIPFHRSTFVRLKNLVYFFSRIFPPDSSYIERGDWHEELLLANPGGSGFYCDFSEDLLGSLLAFGFCDGM